MKKRKSLFCTLCSVLVIMCLFSLTMLPALASNHVDTSFRFSFSGGTPKQTAWRLKTDDSNVYMNVEYVGAQFVAHVVGTNNSAVSTGADCSRGYTYSVSAPGEYRMRNWVHDGTPAYTYAAIYAAPAYGFSYSAYGVWSPDSV